MKIEGMLIDLTGRQAIVTGGTGWLGVQICLALLECGAKVFSVSRGLSKMYSIDLFQYPNYEYISADLSVPLGLDKLTKEVGYADILVNNSFGWPKSLDFLQSKSEDITSTLAAGVVSPLMVTQRFLPEMMRQGRGSIINVCSMYGHVSPDHSIYKQNPGMGSAIDYGIAKAAMLQATRYLASISGHRGVRVNSISPGPFPRPGTFDDGKEWFKEELKERTMLKRVGEASEIKGVIAFLASDMSSYVTGADIPIDGGWTAY